MVEVSEAAKAKASELLRNIVPGFEPDVCAFIQPVSDAAREASDQFARLPASLPCIAARNALAPFILPDPVDPLEEALRAAGYGVFPDDLARVKEALAKRGLKIVREQS